jgi:hypothetical protein
MQSLGFAKEEPGSFSVPTPVVFEPMAPQKWEYHVARIDTREQAPLDEDALGALGAEGWLLAGVLTLPGRADAPYLLYYFVRAA